ncbi:DHHA2 domain [Popillia japonica]|uniref:DHHA2 domain n=1 Tax=Popillia japonica TaxID=7064 RepID=A0AAW1KHC9_POPJA
MDSFLNYILKITALLQFPKNIHIIMGNEACDLDSTVSALSLAYFMHENRNTVEDSITLPLLNVKKEEFDLRIENCYVLDQIGVNRSTLFYKDTLNMKDLLNNYNVKLTLVDHHVLAQDQQYLKPNVVGIFDHRPRDPNVIWSDNVDVKLQLVGSCATLITDEIYAKNPSRLSPTLAKILYETVIFDTIGLSPQAGKVKDLDIEVSKKLEQFLQIPNPDHQGLFNKLWAEHNNVSHLTPRQLLIKDMKFVENVLIPGLPMLVKDFLNLPDILDCLKGLSNEKNATVIILMGLEAKDGLMERDLGFYSIEEDSDLLKHIIDNLKQNDALQLEEGASSIAAIKYFKQNHKPSRKQLLPLVRDLLTEYKQC